MKADPRPILSVQPNGAAIYDSRMVCAIEQIPGIRGPCNKRVTVWDGKSWTAQTGAKTHAECQAWIDSMNGCYGVRQASSSPGIDEKRCLTTWAKAANAVLVKLGKLLADDCTPDPEEWDALSSALEAMPACPLVPPMSAAPPCGQPC